MDKKQATADYLILEFPNATSAICRFLVSSNLQSTVGCTQLLMTLLDNSFNCHSLSLSALIMGYKTAKNLSIIILNLGLYIEPAHEVGAKFRAGQTKLRMGVWGNTRKPRMTSRAGLLTIC